MSLLPFEDRNFDFKTIYNFRDFGGYEAVDGRSVKSGRLFRSAHLANLSDGDHVAIGGLGVDVIIDLRHAPERKRQPSRLPLPKPHLLEYPDAPHAKSAKVAPHEAFLEHELFSAKDAHRYMMGSYTARPKDAGFQKIAAQSLRFMAASDSHDAAGVLIHCAAGKDRTGTLCALILSLLGVSQEDIMADYMMTLEAVNLDEIIAPAAALFTERYGRNIDAESIWPMFGVMPEFLQAALEGMIDETGSVETYLYNEIGVTPEEVSRIRDRYLAR
jgi:protein-tyrosine phosphatase